MSEIRFQDISFVVQGAIDPVATPKCLQSIRHWYPGSEIILSTWDGSDVANLDYDTLVVSPDPGAYCASSEGKPIMANGNRQIVSTKNGLQKVTRPYAVKLRNDIIFTGNQWAGMWDRFPRRVPDWRMFRERVITGSWYARNPLRETGKPFHPSDWFMFGLLEDLMLVWDVELEPEPEDAYWFRTRPHPTNALDPDDTRRYLPEQYLWKTLMQKFGPIKFDNFADASPENIRLTQLTFANNLIILEPHHFSFFAHKYPNPKRAWRYCCYSHREWVRLYREYCCGEKTRATLSRYTDLHHLYEAIYVSVPQPVRARLRSLFSLKRQLRRALRAN